jgi:aldose 1-epimerase
MIELVNVGGCRAVISPMGCSLVSLRVPDRDGELVDVVLGYGDEGSYRDNRFYLGCVVGPYAGRIDRGNFTLDGKRCQLSVDDSGHHLHGGRAGLHRLRWQVLESTRNRAALTCTVAAGEGGYPASLAVTVTYRLTDEDSLQIDYHATTDGPTVVNLTHHAYFNLAGHDSGDVLNHSLFLDAEAYAPLRPDLIPTGEIVAVAGSPLDFLRPFRIGERIDSEHDQLQFAGGYDHAWLLNPDCAGLETPAARLSAPASGISMSVYTDQPTIQFYSGNGLPHSWPGKGGARYGHRQGLCLETQHLPDSPNQPGFPSTTLYPRETYRSSTRFHFTATGGAMVYS